MVVGVSFQFFGPFTEEHGRWLGQLVDDLVQISAIPDYDGRLDVFVLPNEQIPAAVNGTIAEGTYTPGHHLPAAIAMPQVIDGGLRCSIFLAAEEVSALTDVTRPDKLISVMWEELLHVWVYATRWLAFGYLDPPGGDDRRRSIRQMVRGMHDEYIVGRRKALLAFSLPIFDAPGQPGYVTTRVLAYGGNVLGCLEKADDGLGELFERIPPGTPVSHVAINDELPILYRLALEPLARDAACRDGTPLEVQSAPINYHETSRFYREWLGARWPRMLEQLRRSFESDLVEMENMLRALADDLEQLLAAMDAAAHF